MQRTNETQQAWFVPQCFSESVRGKKDWLNGALGGIAAGGVLGLRSEINAECDFPLRVLRPCSAKFPDEKLTMLCLPPQSGN